MGFQKLEPIYKNSVSRLQTNNSIDDQLWAQLRLIRHLSKPKGINANKAMIPWIDQAEFYFRDALTSNWRTSGLLYYYCFLNLSKAYLVGKKYLTIKEMKSTSIYHGLTADPQNPKSIIDFEVKIMPPTSNGKVNIFSSFYQKVIGKNWPYTGYVTIHLKDIINYCYSINSEIKAFYNIDGCIVPCQSMIRQKDKKFWFEICTPTHFKSTIMKDLHKKFICIDGKDLSEDEKEEWFRAYQITRADIVYYSFIQSEKVQSTENNANEVISNVYVNASKYLKNMVHPYPENSEGDIWHYNPKLVINSKSIYWCPLLTDYIISFTLSTILRYHPHLLQEDNKDSYLAKAWCKQSSILALRYYLMLFSDPMITLN